MKKKTEKFIEKEIKILRKEWRNIIFNFIFMILSIFMVVLFYENLILTTILLLIIALLGLIKWNSKLTLIIFIVFGVLFGLGETFVVGHSPWKYLVSNWIGVPIWLFVLWGNTAAFIYQTIRELTKLGIKK